MRQLELQHRLKREEQHRHELCRVAAVVRVDEMHRGELPGCVSKGRHGIGCAYTKAPLLQLVDDALE